MAFEPHPDTFKRLVDHSGSNGRFAAFNLALGDTVGMVDFFEYGSSTVNSLVPNSRHAVHFAEQSHRRQVQCTTLDAFCVDRGIASIDVLKIDVEGFELGVLKGAKDLLAGGRIRFVYLEYNDISADREAFGGSLAEIDSFLRQFGFRFVSSYTDNVVLDDPLFIVANALFMRPLLKAEPHVATP